jgi:uncharacterized protein YsxB (DUF464 family)
MKKRRGNEISEENRAKKKNLQNVILDIAYITGVVSMAILAPNAVQALRKLGLTPHKRQIESIKESTEKLIRKGFLEIEVSGTSKETNLTFEVIMTGIHNLFKQYPEEIQLVESNT